MAEHYSQRSSLADLDYYNGDTTAATHSPSPSAYSVDDSATYPGSSSHSRTASSQAPAPQHSVRERTSLAHIAVPSFSAFRSQASSIPITSPSGTKRKPLPLKAHSPSISLGDVPSPRLAQPPSRPFSLDSPRFQQSPAPVDARTASLTQTPLARQDQRWVQLISQIYSMSDFFAVLRIRINHAHISAPTL